MKRRHWERGGQREGLGEVHHGRELEVVADQKSSGKLTLTIIKQKGLRMEQKKTMAAE
jgi:hypothetical protein